VTGPVLEVDVYFLVDPACVYLVVVLWMDASDAVTGLMCCGRCRDNVRDAMRHCGVHEPAINFVLRKKRDKKVGSVVLRALKREELGFLWS